MSRIGKKPISIPSGVTVTATGGQVTVKGPKGELELTQRPEVSIRVDGGQVVSIDWATSVTAPPAPTTE